MKETPAGKIEYHIKKFMYALGIKGSSLLVYAAIYSFTVGERGLFHGSQKYLADSIGVSVRTVQNSLKKLFSLELIERYATEDGRYSGVRCVMERTLPSREDKKEEKAQKPSERTGEETESRSYDSIYRRIAETRLAGAPDHEKNTYIMMQRYEKSGDNRRFMTFGRSGGVIMTAPQYRRLLEILPTEELMPYLVKLENMLLENIKNGRKPPHSHYKLIKKWIEEDVSL